MTTPQPAALPELSRGQIIDLISPLSNNSADHDIEFAHRVIAALQPQPAAAGVSDADVWELWLRVCAESDNVSTRVMIANFARAILALRPQAVPMTPEQMRTLVVECGYDHASSQERADFINGVRTGERWHGITAQGAQGGEAQS